jgi:hypothetical protein
MNQGHLQLEGQNVTLLCSLVGLDNSGVERPSCSLNTNEHTFIYPDWMINQAVEFRLFSAATSTQEVMA